MDKNVPPGAAILLAFIYATETGKPAPDCYEVIFGNRQSALDKPLTSMTLTEVQAAQKVWASKPWAGRFRSAKASSAAGAPQLMRDTLAGLIKELGLRGTQKLDANLQDRLAYHLLKRRGYDQFIVGKLSLNAFANNLAMEWASFPVLTAIAGAHRPLAVGQSYYAGDGLNKALVDPAKVRATLSEVLNEEDRVSEQPPPIPIDLPDIYEPEVPKKHKTLVDLLRGFFVQQAANHIASTLKENGMNTNFLHNLLNIAIAIVAVLSLPEVVAVLPPELGVVIAGVIGVLKTVINLFRDGLGGLVKQQPPVR